MKRVSFIGAGKVATTLAALTARSPHFEVGNVISRNLDSARKMVAFAAAGRAMESLGEGLHSDIWILSVPDKDIAEVAERLARSGALRHGDIVAHCSGAYASDLLVACERVGARTASFHPIRSFADPALARDRFQGTVCTIEGGEEASRVLSNWLVELGATVTPLQAEQKLKYHTGHVFASNYLVALVDVALAQFEQVGIDRTTGLSFVGPLLEATVANITSLGVEAALTGPIARGDAELVQKQARQISGSDYELYTALGLVAVNIAVRAGKLSPEVGQQVKDVLTAQSSTRE